MNKEETLALYAQGRDVWNAWAKEMLARRAELETKGEWASGRDSLGGERPENDSTKAWMAAAAARFDAHVFVEEADFAGFSFPSRAAFETVTFRKDAWFNNATFNGAAVFEDATFEQQARFGCVKFIKDGRFECATFSQSAVFYNVSFNDYAVFKSTTFSEDTRFGDATFGRFSFFNHATFDGQADFRGATFSGFVQFDGTVFSAVADFGRSSFGGYAGFKDVTFRGEAVFESVTFDADAWFLRANFSNDVRFDKSTFNEMSVFECATFSGFARFEDAIFSQSVGFGQATFRGFTTFAGCTFASSVDFNAVDVERSFTLAEARFADVPGFTQAHFSEAPQFDDVIVPEVRGFKHLIWPLFKAIEADKQTSARFRALKRLAIQAHDHTREQDYFASELKALRGHPDVFIPCPLNSFRRDEEGNRRKCWPGGLRGTARYWFGLGYEAVSDFGRSMVLPLFWLVLSALGFAWAYLGEHFGRAVEAGRSYGMSSGGWLWSWLTSLFQDVRANPLTCFVGQDTQPAWAALGLSIRKALPFAGVGSTEKLNQIHACLYGVHGDALAIGSPLPDRFTPVIPDAVDYLGIVQLLLSLVLLFLFLLAVRNHFRIR